MYTNNTKWLQVFIPQKSKRTIAALECIVSLLRLLGNFFFKVTEGCILALV